MSRKSTIISNWPKYILQWGCVLALIVFFTGIIPSLNRFVESFSLKIIPVTDLSIEQMAKGIGLFAVIVLFSKLFCAYICPLGTVQDILMKLHKPLHIKTLHIPDRSLADLLLRFIKYGMVFLITYIILSEFKIKPTIWMISGIAAVFLIGSFTIDRFWCRYICPAGALINTLRFWIWIIVPLAACYVLWYFEIYIPWEIPLGVLCFMAYLLEIIRNKPKMQLVHVVKDELACIHCHTCIDRCPYHIDIKPCHNGKIKSIDCNLCGECVASCPAGALNFGVRRGRRGKLWKFVPALLTIAIALFIIWATGNL